ncbi:MAG TPA: type II toxin-antitoxin system VapC family toxin [Candidatus Limnocylindrales bacterium]|nr:type II toxin-antitoxin system VapC family toxin [Candidatus Limnocylindrales bacterium]
MSPAIVLDASVALTFVLRQQGVVDVDARLERWRRSGDRLCVPSSFWLEVSNSLLRRHGFPAGSIIEAIHRLDEFGLETVEVDRAMTLLALDRAERFGLTTYDAAYLAVAEALDATLYTSDRALLSAAGWRGIAVDGAPGRRRSEVKARYGPERPSTWPDYSGASAYLAKLRAEATRAT